MNFKLSARNLVTIQGVINETYKVTIGEIEIPYVEKLLTSITYDTLDVICIVTNIYQQLMDLSTFTKKINCNKINVRVEYNIFECDNEYVVCKPVYNISTITDHIMNYVLRETHSLIIEHVIDLTDKQIKQIKNMMHKYNDTTPVWIYDKSGLVR